MQDFRFSKVLLIKPTAFLDLSLLLLARIFAAMTELVNYPQPFIKY